MKKMTILTFVLLLCIGCGKSEYEKAQEQVDKNLKEMKKEVDKSYEEVKEEARRELQKALDKIGK